MKILIKETQEYKLYHHKGITKFKGCQCFKDCTCNEDFVSGSYNYYSIVKKFGKYKTTIHNDLQDVKERIKLLLNVPNKKYHESNK